MVHGRQLPITRCQTGERLPFTSHDPGKTMLAMRQLTITAGGAEEKASDYPAWYMGTLL